MRIAQNKCICLCLELPPHGHVSPSHFRKINWFPVECRVEPCTSTTVFKYWKGIAPSYINMFIPSLNNYSTRSQMELDIPLCRTNKGQERVQNCKSEQIYLFIFYCYCYHFFFFYFNFLEVHFFFNHIYLRSYL